MDSKENSVQYCTKCVISNQRPSSVVEFKNKSEDIKPKINFIEGVCSACLWSIEKEKINWKDRKSELHELCDKFRSKDGSYDCVVPGSGGKDSAFASHYLKKEFGMNPLTVTWAPHKYTDIGWQNFQSWIQVGGFDNILIHPSGNVHRKLTRLAFENLGHPFQPFIIGQKLIGPRTSIMYDIPLVFYGENQAEYGNKIEDNHRPTMDLSFFSESKAEDLTIGGIPKNNLIKDYGFKTSDFNMYNPIDFNILKQKKTQVHYLSYYVKWDPQEMFYYAAENTGFRPNNERSQGSYSKYAGIDDILEWLHFYMIFIKFGIGRATYDASQEIRNNKITREEGVALVQKYDHEFPDKYLPDFLEYLDLDEKKLWEIIDKFRSPEIWLKKNNSWLLKTQVT